MRKKDVIFVIGDKRIVGSSLVDCFKSKGFRNVFGESDFNVNLEDKKSVASLIKKNRPQYVFLSYTHSGGILANVKHPAELIYSNLQIQSNIIHYSYRFGVKKIVFFASSCVYPKNCPQPIKEEYLLRGRLEETSQAYAIAKIAGIKMCQAYRKQYGLNCISIIPATVYGPGDDFDSESSHVIASLIRRFAEAKVKNKKEVMVWGTGKPRREFIYIDDLISACIFLTKKYNDSEIINVGSGQDISIKELAQLIKKIVGFKGEITFDTSRPEGVKRKLLDISKIKKLDWMPKISLKKGLKITYDWYKANF